MKVTASNRLFQRRCCTRHIRGQVATTIIVAQIKGARKGRMIQKDEKISPPMNKTASVVRVSSERGSFIHISGKQLDNTACRIHTASLTRATTLWGRPTDKLKQLRSLSAQHCQHDRADRCHSRHQKSSRFAKPDANWYSASHAARQGQLMGLSSAILGQMVPFFPIRLNYCSSSIGDAAPPACRK